MRIYTVHAPDERIVKDSGDLGAYAERFVFVPERFSLLAMLFALPWLLVHRLWLATLGYLVLIVAISTVVTSLGLGQQALGFFSFAVSVLLGFEAHNLRRRSLSRSGYRLIAVVSAPSLQDAEQKFFSQWVEEMTLRRETGAPTGAVTATP